MRFERRLRRFPILQFFNFKASAPYFTCQSLLCCVGQFGRLSRDDQELFVAHLAVAVCDTQVFECGVEGFHGGRNDITGRDFFTLEKPRVPHLSRFSKGGISTEVSI